MGFNIEIHSILRTDEDYDLTIGAVLPFAKAGSRLFFDSIPVWLTDSRWRVLAEISIVSQTRADNQLSGKFRVDYLYLGEEQQVVTAMFIRMYGGLFDPNIYVLSSQAEYDKARQAGELSRDSLNTEGFIHASPSSQLNRVANKFYREVENPLVMVVDQSAVIAPVRWEPATGGLYPHIYGPLNMSALVRCSAVALDDGDIFNIDTTRI